MALALELAVQDAAGARVAREIGAARIELTQALALGGLTPSQATIEEAVAIANNNGPEVHVLVRPRGGGFTYNPEEIDTVTRDIQLALAAGAHGVVIGAITATGTLDTDALTRWKDAAGDAPVTVHRAIDLTRDKIAALATIRELGFVRALTSGGASYAIDGLDTLRAMVAAADGIQIMAGGGITADNVAEIAASGVDAVHFSAKRTVTGTGNVRMGSAADGVGGHEVTGLAAARAIVDALAAAGI
ncbi:copper homeostasis protein CutC [Microbacterium sp. YY-01]|uniref:copper homeostasis protein CutC n=1 Tax=Microbacterium sp. YY-01 TaxID=3421634 RepID=UPI003D165DCC